jgi:hypothetical protein
LLAAVTALGTEDISGKALGMYAHQWGSEVNVSHNQRGRFFHSVRLVVRAIAEFATKSEDAKFPPASGEVGSRDLSDR